MYRPVNLMNLKRIFAKISIMFKNRTIKFAMGTPSLNYFIICKLYINKKVIVKYYIIQKMPSYYAKKSTRQ